MAEKSLAEKSLFQVLEVTIRIYHSLGTIEFQNLNFDSKNVL